MSMPTDPFPLLSAARCPDCIVNGWCQCTQPCGHPTCEAAAEEARMMEMYPNAMSTYAAPGKLTACVQSWRGDDGLPHFCGEDRGHSGECRCEGCGRTFSETAEMV